MNAYVRKREILRIVKDMHHRLMFIDNNKLPRSHLGDDWEKLLKQMYTAQKLLDKLTK